MHSRNSWVGARFPRRIGSGSALTVFRPISTNFERFRAAWLARYLRISVAIALAEASAPQCRVNASFSDRHEAVYWHQCATKMISPAFAVVT